MPRRLSLFRTQSGVLRLSQLRHKDSLAAHRRSVIAAFVGLGFHVGVWTVLLADMIAALDMSPRTTGTALSVLAAAGIVTLIAGGHVADRIGHRAILIAGVGGTGGFFLLLAQVDTVTGLMLVFAIGGATAGCYDLAVNTLGGDFERNHHVQMMTTFHAGFSFGAAAGALGAGLALSGGFSYQTTLVFTGAMLLLLATGAVFTPLAAPPPVPPSGQSRTPVPRVRLLSTGVIFAATIVVFAFLTDAALEGYVSYYLRTLLGSGPLLGASGIAAYYLAVAFGRLASTVVLRWIGERSLLMGAGLAAAVGLLIAISTGSAPVATTGLLLVGIALSPVAPIAFSLAARSSPGREARAVSMVTIAAYGVFLAGPVVIGALATATSLRIAWLLPIAGLGALALLAWRAPADILQDARGSEQPAPITPSIPITTED